MKRYNKVTPEGTKDVLFRECVVRRRVEDELASFFSARSYHEVMTPGIEFYDVFDGLETGILPENMYKTTDQHGRLVVLRPDSTVPIARLTATRLQNLPRPIRLFYNHPVYRSNVQLTGRSDETEEFGIELLGASGLKADLEAISAAAQALERSVGRYRIEIGHADVFRSLARSLPVSEEVREDIRVAIESKNYAELSNLLDPLGDLPAAAAMRRLPRLFGGAEVFEDAAALVREADTLKTLDYLRTLYEALCRMGLSEQVIVDLGLVQRNNYYTGVVFSAYVEDWGDAVLFGGRYDHLLENFDCPMPAIGFSVRVDAITRLRMMQEKEPDVACVLIHSDAGFEAHGLQVLSDCTQKGMRCENSVFESREEAADYARVRGISKVIFVSDQIEEVSL